MRNRAQKRFFLSLTVALFATIGAACSSGSSDSNEENGILNADGTECLLRRFRPVGENGGAYKETWFHVKGTKKQMEIVCYKPMPKWTIDDYKIAAQLKYSNVTRGWVMSDILQKSKLLKDIIPHPAEGSESMNLFLSGLVSGLFGIGGEMIKGSTEQSKARIEANKEVKKTEIQETGQTDRERLSQTGQTDRERLSQTGQTERLKIEADTVVDLQELFNQRDQNGINALQNLFPAVLNTMLCFDRNEGEQQSQNNSCNSIASFQLAGSSGGKVQNPPVTSEKQSDTDDLSNSETDDLSKSVSNEDFKALIGELEKLTSFGKTWNPKAFFAYIVDRAGA